MISSTQYDTGYCMLYDTYCYDTVLVYSTVLHLQYVYCILYTVQYAMWYGIIPLLCRSYNSMISYDTVQHQQHTLENLFVYCDEHNLIKLPHQHTWYK